jgi:hypothetical protein
MTFHSHLSESRDSQFRETRHLVGRRHQRQSIVKTLVEVFYLAAQPVKAG